MNSTLSDARKQQQAIASAVGFVVLLVFFRQQVLGGFTFTFSDRYDGIIAVSLLEHWFNVLRGLSHWSSPNYFFPYANTLSLNEGFFLYGLAYSFFRTLSFDPFISSELVNIVVKAIGFSGFIVAAQRMLKLPFGWSLLGAAIFTLSNNTYLCAGHAQLLSVAFVPVEAVLIYEAYTALMTERRRRFLAFGAAAAVFFSAWLLTAIYMAWFFAFFLLIAVLNQFAIAAVCDRPALARLLRAVIENKANILAIGAIAAVSLMPFVSVYILGEHATKQRLWEEVLYYIPSLADSINVGPSNLLFGGILKAIKGCCVSCDIGLGERELGFTPILFLLMGMCIVAMVLGEISPPHERKILILGIAIASVVAWALSLRVGLHTGWSAVYQYWPGGSGLRVVSRLYVFLYVPVVALVVWYLSRSKWSKPRLVLICSLLVAEQFNGLNTANLNRLQEVERTISVPTPPTECRSFFVTASPDTVDDNPAFTIGAAYPHNVDAMLIAELINLPTINGFASFNPADWDFDHPTRIDYPERIGKYATHHHLAAMALP